MVVDMWKIRYLAVCSPYWIKFYIPHSYSHMCLIPFQSFMCVLNYRALSGCKLFNAQLFCSQHWIWPFYILWHRLVLYKCHFPGWHYHFYTMIGCMTSSVCIPLVSSCFLEFPYKICFCDFWSFPFWSWRHWKLIINESSYIISSHSDSIRQVDII